MFLLIICPICALSVRVMKVDKTHTAAQEAQI